jgi:hypothetical protein
MSNQINRPEFFMVWKEGSDRTTPTYKHSTYPQALDEAKRLTRMHGGKFHVLCQLASVELNDLKVTELSIDEIPF